MHEYRSASIAQMQVSNPGYVVYIQSIITLKQSSVQVVEISK